MIKIHQTTFGAGKGNCFQTCVASIFELPLSDVPNFCVDYGDEEWWAKLEEWCATRGVAPLTFTFDKGEQTIDPTLLRNWHLRPDVSVILSGENGWRVPHSVVLTGDDIWDPNPNGCGLASYRDIICFVALHGSEKKPASPASSEGRGK